MEADGEYSRTLVVHDCNMPMPLTKPGIENETLMARYPFLPQGTAFVKLVLEKNGITVELLSAVESFPIEAWMRPQRLVTLASLRR